MHSAKIVRVDLSSGKIDHARATPLYIFIFTMVRLKSAMPPLCGARVQLKLKERFAKSCTMIVYRLAVSVRLARIGFDLQVYERA
jgi:hypothetical protein